MFGRNGQAADLSAFAGPLMITSNTPTKRVFRCTQLCAFWARGSCKRGANCAFAHGEAELRETPNLSKTKSFGCMERAKAKPAAVGKAPHTTADVGHVSENDFDDNGFVDYYVVEYEDAHHFAGMLLNDDSAQSRSQILFRL
eukprot:g31614.t1